MSGAMVDGTSFETSPGGCAVTGPLNANDVDLQTEGAESKVGCSLTTSRIGWIEKEFDTEQSLEGCFFLDGHFLDAASIRDQARQAAAQQLEAVVWLY